MQIVIVTGSAQGIGAEIAREFWEQGDYVILCDYKKITPPYTERCEVCPVDISSRESVEAAVNGIIERHGRIDVLVNNAGITRDSTVRKMSPEQWDAVIGTNLTGTFQMCQAVMRPMMRLGYGRIINITSAIAEMGNVGQANYGASKAGVLGLTRTLALECIRHGITVNAVSPGFIYTDMTKAMSPQALAAAEAKIPFGKFGEPSDIANAVLFLAKPESRYLVGEVIHVNGGLWIG